MGLSGKAAIGQQEIAEGLRELGLERGDAVEVHSSLSSFGWVDGGADAVLEALIDVVGESGAIVMSAYPVGKPIPPTDEERQRGILAKVQTFDESYDGPTGMGVIADTFRERPDTILGQGFYRVCAWGRDADQFARGYQVLLERDGLSLLLGVPIDRCSSMHQAESVGIPQEVQDCFRLPDDLRRDYPDDYYIDYGRAPLDGWETVLAEAERRGLIRRRNIGDAACMLFRAREIVGIYEHALKTDPLALWGL